MFTFNPISYFISIINQVLPPEILSDLKYYKWETIISMLRIALSCQKKTSLVDVMNFRRRDISENHYKISQLVLYFIRKIILDVYLYFPFYNIKILK